MERLLRDSQLRGSTTPEQVAGRGGENDMVGSEVGDARTKGVGRHVVKLRVGEQHLVPLALEQRARIPELQWEVRFAAAEVDTAAERPVRVDERELHDARPA